VSTNEAEKRRWNDEEWARVFAAFGPHVPDEERLARRRQHVELNVRGMELTRGLDIVDELHRVESPTLVSVGELDPVTPIAAAKEIFDGLPRAIGRLEVVAGAGHFTWLDAPDRYWPVLIDFVTSQPESREPSPSDE